MATPRLHQVLAVRDDLKNKANLIQQETKKTFSSKGDHFDGLTKSYQKIKEDSTSIPNEVKELVTTVKDKLEFSLASVVASIDAETTVSETNSSGVAVAELKVGEVSFGKFSAITLLDLEKAFTNLRAVYGEIPTLDPTKSWKNNSTSIPNTYASDKQVTYRSEKSKKVVTLAPASDKFPAQAQVFDSEDQVGFYETTWISGKITPTQKSDLLQKIDNMILAVKDAKSQANNVDAKDIKVGQRFIDFINKGIL